MSTIVCWNCGGSLEDIPRPISRHATCSKCFNELHCCRLCRHFDSNANMTCLEDRADPPLQKENANFCDFFAPKPNAFEPASGHESEQARADLDALFGADDNAADADDAAVKGNAAVTDEQTTLSKEELAKHKLDDLFR